ncbi:MAG: BamA/TamA family outer membrane protein [Myxococcota bacterium]|nr:BamA/TamA family outer membrane protein [Myxococcota bacterium]
MKWFLSLPRPLSRRSPLPPTPEGAALCALLLLACATDEGGTRAKGPVIEKIKIDGADQVDADDIKAKILTTESAWYSFLPFTEKERLDPNAWQADLRRIERYYEAQGYYQAEVLEDQILPQGTDAVSLVVRVKEGEPTTIGELKITGLEDLPADVRARATLKLPLQEGKIFYEEAWAGVKGLITSRLREDGYAEATVQGSVEVDLATLKAKISLTVAPGQRFKFGNIFVAAGARPKVPPKMIIAQVQEEVVPGERYSESDLVDGQARVFQMGVFGAVKVNRGAPDREAGTVPVVVDVREAPFHTIKLGAGGGVDQARNEIRAVAEYTDRNFFGGLRRLTTRAKVGYAFIPNVVAVGSGTSTQHGVILDSLAELEQPSFFSNNLRAQASLGLERGIEPAYSFFGGRAKAGLIWQPHPSFSFFPSFNFEGYLLTGQARLGTNSTSLVTGCDSAKGEENAQCDLFLTYLEQTVQWDRRDDPLEPRRGFYLSLSLQQAGLTDFTYLRVVPDVRGYVSFLDDKLTLAGKIRLGSLYPFKKDLSAGAPEDSPIINRFFSGGGNSNRGFNNRRLSPMQIVPRNLKDPLDALGETVPVGGNGLVESSVEVRYSLTGSLVLATFLDAGLVTRESLDFGRIPDNLHYAVGIGLRYRTVVGPIRIDLARRLPIGPPLQITNPGQAYPSDSSCFGLFGSSGTAFSGAPEGLCTFHLSIGEAF